MHTLSPAELRDVEAEAEAILRQGRPCEYIVSLRGLAWPQWACRRRATRALLVQNDCCGLRWRYACSQHSSDRWRRFCRAHCEPDTVITVVSIEA